MARPRKVYDDPQWQQVRRRVLARDGHVCQLRCSRRCRGTANSVDHIVDVADGGARFDMANLQAACQACNTAKRNRRHATIVHAARGASPLRRW